MQSWNCWDIPSDSPPYSCRASWPQKMLWSLQAAEGGEPAAPPPQQEVSCPEHKWRAPSGTWPFQGSGGDKGHRAPRWWPQQEHRLCTDLVAVCLWMQDMQGCWRKSPRRTWWSPRLRTLSHLAKEGWWLKARQVDFKLWLWNCFFISFVPCPQEEDNSFFSSCW